MSVQVGVGYFFHHNAVSGAVSSARPRALRGSHCGPRVRGTIAQSLAPFSASGDLRPRGDAVRMRAYGGGVVSLWSRMRRTARCPEAVGAGEDRSLFSALVWGRRSADGTAAGGGRDDNSPESSRLPRLLPRSTVGSSNMALCGKT